MQQKSGNLLKSSVDAVKRNITAHQLRIDEIEKQIQYFEKSIKGLRMIQTMIKCDMDSLQQVHYDMQRVGIIEGVYEAPFVKALMPQLF
jgi:hypothetical protein